MITEALFYVEHYYAGLQSLLELRNTFWSLLFSFTELRSAFTEHYTALCSSVASYRVFSLLESSIVQLWRIVELCWAIMEQFRSFFQRLWVFWSAFLFRLVSNTFLIPIFSKYDSSFYMWLLACQQLLKNCIF